MPRTLLLLAALVLPAGLLGLSPVPASADHVPHTELRLSIPAADSTVTGAVNELILEFTTSVQAELSRITVEGADGSPVAADPVRHPTDEASNRLRLGFDDPLRDGPHRVTWRTVAPDGHVVEGSFSFRVQGAPAPPIDTVEPPTPPAAPVAADPAGPDQLLGQGALPPGTLQRWLHLLATVLLIGVVAFRLGVIGPLSKKGDMPALTERSMPLLRLWGWLSLGLLAVTLVTRLDRQLLTLGGGERAWEFLGHLLFRTGWGGGWAIHAAVIVLGVTGLVLSRRPGSEGRGWGILTGAAVLLPLVPALQGHAMGSDLRQAAIPTLYLHVGASSVWLGGLLMLVLAGLPAMRKAGTGSGKLPAIARMVNAFSRFALIAVVTLVVTGSATSFLLVDGGVMGSLGSEWGRTMVIKLLLVGGAFLLGFYNWRRVRPSLSERPDPGALRIPASVEAFLGLVVLLATAVLVALPLP